MKLTWKDAVTTLIMAAVIILERAYFHNWNWPLVSGMRWVVIGIATLTVLSLFFSYVLDRVHSVGWNIIAGVFSLSTLALTGLGLYYANSDFVVLLMLNTVLLWAVSMIGHVISHRPVSHGL